MVADPLGPPDLQGPESPGPKLSSEVERATAVASVLRHQKERERIRESVKLPGTKPLFPQLVGLALSTAVAVYLWFGSPGWLSRQPVLPPLEEEEASVAAAIYLQAQQIEAYRARNGRLPAFQEEAGLPVPGVRYARIDSRSYWIEGRDRRVVMTYRSGEPLDSLGRSLQWILGDPGIEEIP